MVSAANHVSVSFEGGETVSAMRPLHPIARYMVDAIVGHGRDGGDGVKSFVLMLEAALNQLSNSVPQGIPRAALSAAISRIASQWLPATLARTALACTGGSETGVLTRTERAVMQTAMCSRGRELLGPLSAEIWPCVI